MSHVIRIISLTVVATMLSACTDTDTSSHESVETAKTEATSHLPHDENHSKKNEATRPHSDDTQLTQTRSAEVHAHGNASLAIVLEGSLITAEFDTPLYNILGFEHVAETPEQKAAVLKAESVLSNGASLIVFNSEAGCSITSETNSVNLNLESREDADHHDEHDNDDHHENNHDEHEDDDDHHEDDHDEHGEEETHKDVIIQYKYQCQRPKALKNVTVNLFESFKNLTEIELVYLGPNTQKQVELNATKPRMDLTR